MENFFAHFSVFSLLSSISYTVPLVHIWNTHNISVLIRNTPNQLTFSLLLQMEEFFSQYPDAGTGQLNREQALETVRFNIRWVEAYATVIEDWLASSSSPWFIIHPNTTCSMYSLTIYCTGSLLISHLGMIHIVLDKWKSSPVCSIYMNLTFSSDFSHALWCYIQYFLFFPGFIFAQFNITHSVITFLCYCQVENYELLVSSRMCPYRKQFLMKINFYEECQV